ncbi:spore coat protein U-like protein [Sphingomonas kaistensis]|uniref:Spore coat protein U-like protein n=1 Tax=Sphingomonas kaistensis TaxID=298708 RepID=A0A7X5Y6G5_9SPHN|nr:spore coat protein U domain-containing protein [Sphingomonas kaistensis]NJC04376.1 spore coat protein U-like protein [Sphingomonas kaistensis]
MSGSARLLRWCLLAILAAMLPAAAQACTLCSCTTSSTSLSFGSYSPVTASPTDATAQVSINCTGVVSLFGQVEITASPGASGAALQRTMSHGGSTLRYNLYADPGRTQVLADGTGGTTTIATPLNGLLVFSTSAPVYGRITAGQWVASGSYADTIVITVQY